MTKKLTGKEWFQRLEHAFPGTLERVCRDMGLRLGRDLDKEVAGVLQEFSDLTGGPQLTPAMVGHARREFGIVRRAALPRPVPAPTPDPRELPLEHPDSAPSVADLSPGWSVQLTPTGEDLDAKISAALERQLPFLVSRISGDLLRALGKEEAPHA